MQFAGKEISELTNEQLSDLTRQLADMSDRRDKVASHSKFNNMEFPPPNQAFLKLQKEVNEEIKKRSMDKW